MNQPYTVTMPVTVFITADSADEAFGVAMEAIFQADNNICANAEINITDSVVQEGHVFTIDPTEDLDAEVNNN